MGLRVFDEKRSTGLRIKGELAPGDVVDDVAVRAAGVLAEKGYWMLSLIHI